MEMVVKPKKKIPMITALDMSDIFGKIKIHKKGLPMR